MEDHRDLAAKLIEISRVVLRYARQDSRFDEFDHVGLKPVIPPEELAMGLTWTAVGFAIQFGAPVMCETRAGLMSAVFESAIEAGVTLG